MPFNRLNHSVLGEIRPRFKLHSSIEPELLAKIIIEAKENDSTVVGHESNGLCMLKIPINDRHYWSPELTVRIEEREDGIPGSYLSCLVGPQQSVWAMFAFIYGAIAMIAVFGGMYGLTQIELGKPSWMVWLFPIGIILLPSIYTLSKIGQKKGRNQMLHLISFLYHSIETAGGNVERTD